MLIIYNNEVNKMMKEKILQLLKTRNDYLSGEEISNILGVSRTAIWKQINVLRNEGYVIESQTKSGYRLVQIPDRLYPEEIKEHLKTKCVGQNICYYQSVNSTNTTAKNMTEKEFAEGLVVITELQTSGKGRLGRQWHSPFGTGIWMSILAKPAIAPADAPQITLLSAVAVAEGITQEAGIKAEIKWPNDVTINGKKVCGILTEIKADMDRIHYIIVGIGINVNDLEFPDEIMKVATSLRIEQGKMLNRAKLAAAVLNFWELYYRDFLAHGFGRIKDQWKKYSVNSGKNVTVRTLKNTIEGIVLDIDDNGMLLVRDHEGVLHKIIAGDVSLRE